jgi:hypothetical protein
MSSALADREGQDASLGASETRALSPASARTAARSEEPTIPSSPRPAAARVARPASEPEASQGLDWCVDRGDRLAPMTTFELWIALATGELSGDARVWRLGMEGWEPARAIPDLACVMPPPGATPEPPESDLSELVRELGPETLRALDAPEAEAATPEPGRHELRSKDDRASASSRPSAIEVFVAHPALAARVARSRVRRFARRTLTPITLGSAVASAAVALALVWVAGRPPARPIAAHTASAQVRAIAASAEIAASAPVVDAPAPPRLADVGTRHERGQRRLRSGAHR